MAAVVAGLGVLKNVWTITYTYTIDQTTPLTIDGDAAFSGEDTNTFTPDAAATWAGTISGNNYIVTGLSNSDIPASPTTYTMSV